MKVQTISLANRAKKAGYEKIFVTGASGFIGRVLTERLAEGNIDVTGLYRNPYAEKYLADKGIEPVQGDINRPSDWSHHLDDCDALFHLAALATPWHRRPQTFFDVNFKGAKNVFHAAEERKVGRIVFTSTAGTMGYRETADAPLIDESSFSTPPLGTLYEQSKFKAEKYAKKLHREQRTSIVTVNPSRVFGPGEINESNSVTKLISWYLKGLWRIIPGDGTSVGNFVFIEDVLQGHLRALLHGESGQRYILGGDNVDFNTFFSLIGKITGRERWMYRMPLSLMISIAQGDEWRARHLGGKPLISESFVKKYMRHFQLSSEKAGQALDYRPRSLERGISQTVNWIRDNS